MPYIDETELDQPSSGQYISEDELDPIQPQIAPRADTTGSYLGDAQDFIGGASKGYLNMFGRGLATPIDLGADLIASGINSIATGDLQWTGDQPGLADYFSEGLEDVVGDVQGNSAAGRIGERTGETAGTAASFITGGKAISELPGWIGKVGTFLSSNPLKQLGLTAAGGAAGQSAVEADLVEPGSLGQLAVELGVMTGPDLIRAGISGAKGALNKLYQGADDAAGEVWGQISRAVDDPSVFALNAGDGSTQVAREELLGTLAKNARRRAGTELGAAKETLEAISPELAQDAQYLSNLKRAKYFKQGNLDELSRAIDDTAAKLDSIPSTVTKESPFPLVFQETGEFFGKIGPKTLPNPVREAIDVVADSKAEFSEIASDLQRAFRNGKVISEEAYQDAASKIGAKLLKNPQNARAFREIADSQPGMGGLGRAAVLQETFKGTPTSWMKRIDDNRGSFQELFSPEIIKGLEAVATKNRNLVGGLLGANIVRMVGSKYLAIGLASLGSLGAGVKGVAAGYALSKAAKSIAEKPQAMQTAISKAFQNADAARFLSQKATPENIKKAVEFISNAGKTAIMGANIDEDDTQLDNLGIPSEEPSTEKKSEPTPDVDLSPPKTSVPAKLVSAVIKQESSGNPDAVGPETKYGTAKGLMQLLDTTGREWHKKLGLPGEYDPFDAEQNQKIGTAYLEHLIEKSDGDIRMALAKYNYGMGNIARLQKRYGDSFDDIKDALPSETKDYVRRITKNYSTEV